MRRSQIFLADLLRGIDQLKIRDAEVARSVLRMLSLDRLEAAPEALRQAAAVGPGVDRATASTQTPEMKTPPVQRPPQLSSEARSARLERRARGTAAPPAPPWLDSTPALARPAGPTPPSRLFQPLFPRTLARGLLSATLATLDRDGPLDIQACVEEIAQLRPLREFPREQVTTLRLGAQVLVDSGLGMAPFRPDVDDLIARIGQLLAPGQVSLLHFAGTPARGCVPHGHPEMKPWPMPARGTPVLVLTDLGIGAPAGSRDRPAVSEWLAFFDSARLAGVAVTALLPYGPKRWPHGLAGSVRLVHWDHRTTAAAIRRTLGPLLRATR